MDALRQNLSLVALTVATVGLGGWLYYVLINALQAPIA